MKTKKEIQAALRKAKRAYESGKRYYDEKHSTFNPASYAENILEHASDLLGFYGIEAYSPGEWFKCPDYSFINSGDTYSLTLVYSRKRGQFLVSDIGSIIEREELSA